MGWQLSNRQEKVMAEINITPLTDVMLVLLVIFMVTTPILMMDSFKLKLPKASAAGGEKGEGVVVTVSAEGDYFINGRRILKAALAGELKREFKKGKVKSVLIKADTKTEHGLVVYVLDTAKSIGAGKLSIATKPEGRGR